MKMVTSTLGLRIWTNMKQLIEALRETVTLLDRSEDSDWAGRTVAELKQTLGSLYGPTGPIQETAIWNRWTDEYMNLASVVDLYTANK